MEENKHGEPVAKERKPQRKKHWGMLTFVLVNILTGIYLIASLGFMVTADGIIGKTSDGKLLGAFLIALLWWLIAYFTGRSHRIAPLFGLLCAQAMPLFILLPGFLKLVGYWALSPWLPIYTLLPFKSHTAVVVCLVLYTLITVLLWVYASYWRKGARAARRHAVEAMAPKTEPAKETKPSAVVQETAADNEKQTAE